MSELQLTFSTIETFYNSSDSFPVNLDDVFIWLQFNQKSDALSAFMSCEFEEDIDYEVLRNIPQNSGGRPRTDYMLSCDCFKEWGMMSKTPNGKLIRKYFLQCEKIAKEANKQSAIYQEVDKLVKRLRVIEEISPIAYQCAVKALGGEPIRQSLDASLVANRLGLAFNKQIKAFNEIQDATSPEAFDKLKEAYYKLAQDCQDLLLASKPETVYVDRVREVEVVKEVVKRETVEIEISSKRDKARIDKLERMCDEKDDEIKKIEGEYLRYIQKHEGKTLNPKTLRLPPSK